jgi:hypothetical protein
MISAEDAYKRFALANDISVDAMDDAAKKQAFLTEMLRQAEEKVGRLGDTNLDTAGKMEQNTAAVNDLRSNVSKLAAAYAESSGTLDRWRNSLGAWNGIVSLATGLLENHSLKIERQYVLYDQVEAQLFGLTEQEASYTTVIRNAKGATDAASDALWGIKDAIVASKDEMPKLTFEARLYLDELALTEPTAELAIYAVDNFAKANKIAMEQSRKAVEAYQLAVGNFALDATMQWTSYYQDVDEQSATFITDREKLEVDHLKKLEELRKRGMAKTVKFEEDAELAKLATMQERLAIALQSQAEFTDKTHTSTRMAKELQIRTLQSQIAEQETLLEDYYGGRLIKAGENVNALIGEENRRHTEAVAGLEAEIAKTKELQRQQLGTLMLDTFETWAEIKDVPPDAMLEMRTAIAKEYGLITEEEAQLVGLSIQTWNGWANEMYTNTEETVTQLGKDIEMVRNLQTALAELPSMKVIDIVLNTVHAAQSGERVQQVNPMFMGGGAPGETITINNFNQTVNTQATTPAVLKDWETAQALVQ